MEKLRRDRGLDLVALEAEDNKNGQIGKKNMNIASKTRNY